FSQLGAHLGSGYTVVRRADGQINVMYDGTSGSAGSLPAASGSADPTGNCGTSSAIDTGSANTGSDSTTVSSALTPAIATHQASPGNPDSGTLLGQASAGGGNDINQLTNQLGPGYVVVTDADGQMIYIPISYSSDASIPVLNSNTYGSSN